MSTGQLRKSSGIEKKQGKAIDYELLSVSKTSAREYSLPPKNETND